jgi:hypothetical protein
MIRRENKKKQKAEKFMEDAGKTKSKKEKKSKQLKFAKNPEAVSA